MAKMFMRSYSLELVPDISDGISYARMENSHKEPVEIHNFRHAYRLEVSTNYSR